MISSRGVWTDATFRALRYSGRLCGQGDEGGLVTLDSFTMRRHVRRAGCILLVVSMCFTIAACGGATTDRPATAKTAGSSSATPECPQPVAAASSQGETSANEGAASTSGSVAGTLDGLVVNRAATAVDLLGALKTLARNGGALGRQANQIEMAVDAESPAPIGSIEALARARWHLDVDHALGTLSRLATSRCGGELIGSEALSSFAKELPAPGSDGAVKLPGGDGSDTSSWPTAGCKISTDLGYAPPEIAVYGCDEGAVAVDLTSGSTRVLSVLLPAGEKEGRLTLAGDHLAWVTIALTPAHGLTESSWTSALHIIDLTGAKVADRVLQTKHHTVDSSGTPTGVSRIVDGGDGWLLLSYVSSTDPYTYSLTNAVGAVLGSAKYVDGDDRPEPVGLVDLGLGAREYIDEATGKVHPYGGSDRYNGSEVVNDGGCGTDMIAGSEPGFFDEHPAPDTVEHFVRRASGVAVSKASVKTMFSGTDLRASDVAALTPKGVLRSGFAEGHWTFYNFAGTTLWSLGAPVVSVTSAAGHIVALNTSGEQLVIDPATGRKAKLPTEVQQALDSLVPTSRDGEAAAKIVLIDPTTDSMLIQDDGGEAGSTVRKVSYHAMCGDGTSQR